MALEHSRCSMPQGTLVAPLHIMERRIVHELHHGLETMAADFYSLENVLADLTATVLPLPGLLDTCELQDLVQLHLSAASLFRSEINGVLAAQNIMAPNASSQEVDMMLLLHAAEGCPGAWAVIQGLLSLQLFHLQRASALAHEFKRRKLLHTEFFTRSTSMRANRAAAAAAAAAGDKATDSNSSSAGAGGENQPRRSFELKPRRCVDRTRRSVDVLQLPAVYE